MPIVTFWIADNTIPLVELPNGAVKIDGGIFWYDTAKTDDNEFYHCHHCDGWIEGTPRELQENSIGPLSGRQGTAVYCKRCGNEIAFSGMVA